MSQRIIYQTDDGGVAVIAPAPEALVILGIDAIAKKDVPTGKPYKIVDVSELPADSSKREAWTVSADVLNDGVGA